MATQHHCSVRTPSRATSLGRRFWSHVLFVFRQAVAGMVVTGTFRRPPDQLGTFFLVANVHMNNECAKRRSVCIALLLFVRDLCLKLGAVILIGDFNKAVERDTPAGDFGERWISPLEAAFSHANIPWPTSGVTSLWVPGGEVHGHK